MGHVYLLSAMQCVSATTPTHAEDTKQVFRFPDSFDVQMAWRGCGWLVEGKVGRRHRLSSPQEPRNKNQEISPRNGLSRDSCGIPRILELITLEREREVICV